MKLICKEKIRTGKNLSYFGKQLIETVLKETKEQNLKLPLNFSFNHSWEFQHLCLHCKEPVSIIEDFHTKTKNFIVITNLNSKHFNRSLICEIGSFFSKLDSIEIDGDIYLNRNDFDYTFDFQRKSSENLVNYNCENCNTTYLGLIRIGYPLYPEKNLPFGKLGNVEIEEIFEANKPLIDFLKDELS